NQAHRAWLEAITGGDRVARPYRHDGYIGHHAREAIFALPVFLVASSVPCRAADKFTNIP
ncbi:MAG TPA: hypothetical protein VF783_24555, partial [Terriglobales bacterium]